MSVTGDEIHRRLEAAIPEAFSAEGGFVTRWIVLAETIGPVGERGLWTQASSDMKPWDSVGMLHYAIGLEERAWHCEDDEG